MTLLRIIYLLCFVAILVGCSMEKEKLEPSPLEASPDPTQIATPITNTEETNTPTASTNHPDPQYIDESKYEGDELGVVKTLNNIMKTVYEKDSNAYNSLVTGNMNSSESYVSFKKYFISIDKLDFTVNPDPPPPDGAIPVVVEYTELIHESNKQEEDKQLFVFQFEDETWKLLYIADWW